MRPVDRPAGDRHLLHAPTAAACGGGCCFGRAAQAGLGQVGGMGEAGRFPADDADARAPVEPRRQLFDLAVVEAGRRVALVLGEHFGELAAATQGGAEDALEDRLFDHGLPPYPGSPGRSGPLILPTWVYNRAWGPRSN